MYFERGICRKLEPRSYFQMAAAFKLWCFLNSLAIIADVFTFFYTRKGVQEEPFEIDPSIGILSEPSTTWLNQLSTFNQIKHLGAASRASQKTSLSNFCFLCEAAWLSFVCINCFILSNLHNQSLLAKMRTAQTKTMKSVDLDFHHLTHSLYASQFTSNWIRSWLEWIIICMWKSSALFIRTFKYLLYLLRSWNSKISSVCAVLLVFTYGWRTVDFWFLKKLNSNFFLCSATGTKMSRLEIGQEGDLR